MKKYILSALVGVTCALIGGVAVFNATSQPAQNLTAPPPVKEQGVPTPEFISGADLHEALESVKKPLSKTLYVENYIGDKRWSESVATLVNVWQERNPKARIICWVLDNVEVSIGSIKGNIYKGVWITYSE